MSNSQSTYTIPLVICHVPSFPVNNVATPNWISIPGRNRHCIPADVESSNFSTTPTKIRWIFNWWSLISLTHGCIKIAIQAQNKIWSEHAFFISASTEPSARQISQFRLSKSFYKKIAKLLTISWRWICKALIDN